MSAVVPLRVRREKPGPVLATDPSRPSAGRASGGGKVTSQHGLIYHELIEGHGSEAANAYADMNQAAIGDIADICERYAIDSAWTPSDAYVFADSDEEVDDIRKEAAAAQELGLPAELTDETELPVPVALALRYTGQHDRRHRSRQQRHRACRRTDARREQGRRRPRDQPFGRLHPHGVHRPVEQRRGPPGTARATDPGSPQTVRFSKARPPGASTVRRHPGRASGTDDR